MAGLLKAFVLSIFPLAVLATSIDYPDGIVLPPTYQSNHLTFNDWVLLFTLCLAPLIAHIVAGVPPIVYLSKDRPTWRQKLGLYNPTTIIWRYFSITDRRLRAKHWSAAALSASNVYFWTRVGWDGSDALVRKSQAYCVSFPQSKHATLISWSTVKTIIVTLQGADALFYLLGSYFYIEQWTNGNSGFNNTISLGSLFTPLAIIGLLRLVACFWLTEDFVYVNCEEVQTTLTRLNEEMEQEQQQDQIQQVPMHIRAQNSSTAIKRFPFDDSGTFTEEDYRSPNTWLSWLFRAFFLVQILGLIILCTAGLLTLRRDITTSTSLGVLLFYDIFLATTATILGYYFIRSRNTTTVLPCLASPWYQIYSGTLYICMVVLIIIASLETRKSSCGFYTTYSSDVIMCGSTLASANDTTDGVFGLAVIGNTTSNPEFNFTQPQGEMSLLYFQGGCQGFFIWNDNNTGVEGFRFVNTSDRNSFL